MNRGTSRLTLAVQREPGIMDIKARGNEFFRDGDFRGAANEFQRALENADQVKKHDFQIGSTSDAADFEVACLCNLSYAYIKLGSMDEAEEACCQALNRRPSCAKALFRRGQARLALGRPSEAASDFREVCLLEPDNVEATKMLHLARGGDTGHSSPPEVPSSHDSETTTSAAAASTNQKDAGPLSPETAVAGSSDSVCNTEDAELEQGETQGGANHHRVDASRASSSSSPSAPSFMVPGWLTSAEREQGNQLLEQDNANHDRSMVARSGGAEGAVSVSKLVSRLSLSHTKAASKATEKETRRESATTGAVQAEWLRLQADENTRVQRSHSIVKGLQDKAEKREKKKKKKRSERMRTRPKEGPGSMEAIKTSQWWESLEEEEHKVRRAFRARLSVGSELSTKAKEKTKT